MSREREAFEAWAYSNKWNIFRVRDMGSDHYVDDFVNGAWHGWQAKAQAVLEVLKKFCNEHKDPAWRGRLTEYDKGYSDCCIAVLEMIEAQHPSSTSDCPDEP